MATTPALDAPLLPDLFRNPPNEFRPLPGVSLSPDRRANVAELDRLQTIGAGGFVLMPSGGADYLSDRWFGDVKECLAEARRRGLVVWLYDEDGYPSGYAGGRVVKDHPDFESRGLFYGTVDVQGPAEMRTDLLARLAGKLPPAGPGFARVVAYPLEGERIRMDAAIDLTDHIHGTQVGWQAPAGRWRVMGFFELPSFEATHSTTNLCGPRHLTNILDPAAIKRFTECAHDRLNAAIGGDFGGTVRACFTDEPALNTAILGPDQPYGVLPWWKGLPAAFKTAKGYDLVEALPVLFNDAGPRTAKIRCDVFETLAKLCAGSYFGQLDDWCRRHQLASTGHLLWEEHLTWHAVLEGSALACLRRMAVPGMDFLGSTPGASMGVGTVCVPKLVSSAAHVEGKPRTLSETCYFLGGSPSEADLLACAQWKYSLGINTLVLFGANKERAFGDAVGRLGYALSGGRHVADVAVLYPIAGIWANTVFSGRNIRGTGINPQAESIDRAFGAVCDTLLTSQRDYDLVEEESLAAARTSGKVLRIGAESYRVVVLPPTTTVRRSTLARLRAFARAGGIVIGVAPLPASSVERGEDARLQSDIAALFAPGGGAHLLAGADEIPALLDSLLPADIALSPPMPGVTYYHKHAGTQDVYFLSNRGAARRDVQVTLRASGNAALWDHRTGEISPLPARGTADGRRVVTLDFGTGEAHLLVVTEQGRASR